jgi:hypothetical protein
LKGKASEDPLEEVKETIEYRRPREEGNIHNNKGITVNNSLEYDDNSDVNGGLEYNDDILFDFNDDETINEDGLFDKGTDESASRDSGYNNDGTDVIIMEDIDDYYPVKVNRAKRPVW